MSSANQNAGFAEEFLRERIVGMPEEKFKATVKQMYVKPVMIKNETPMRPKKEKQKKRTKASKKLRTTLSTAVKKCKYTEFEPLRQLWREYISELLTIGSNSVDFKAAQEVLLKADFHGANIQVAKSMCESLESIEGTVIVESKNMFQIVTKTDKILHIPKKNSVFLIKVLGLQIYIFGDQFRLKPAHRLVKKFKNYVPIMKVV